MYIGFVHMIVIWLNNAYGIEALHINTCRQYTHAYTLYAVRVNEEIS